MIGYCYKKNMIKLFKLTLIDLGLKMGPYHKLQPF